MQTSQHAAVAQPADLSPHTVDLMLPDAPRAAQRRRPNPWLLGGATATVVLAAGAAAYLLTVSKMEITDVVTPGALVGNGRPQPAQLRYAARGADLRSIEVRYVRGEGGHNPLSWSVPVNEATRDVGHLSAGTLSPVAASPQRITFEYTLVGRDGRRSAPFEKTFDVMPPVRITQLSAPARVPVGQPLAVTLGYQRGGSDVVQVLRRVIESDVPWDATEQALPLLLNQSQGQHELRLDVPARAQRSTLELVLVDATGVRSDPMRVSFSTGAAAPALSYGTVLSVAHLGGASGLGAVGGAVAGGAIGNRFGRGNGRTAMTALGAIGGAIAGHQIEQNVRGDSQWETTVQVDGGGVRRFRHGNAPQWRAGSRVRIAGNAIQG